METLDFLKPSGWLRINGDYVGLRPFSVWRVVEIIFLISIAHSVVLSCFYLFSQERTKQYTKSSVIVRTKKNDDHLSLGVFFGGINKKKDVGDFKLKGHPTITKQPLSPPLQTRSFPLLLQKAKQGFMKGDLEKSEEFLKAIKFLSKEELEPSVRGTIAEMNYAICRRSYIQGNWKKAVRFCEGALFWENHSLAKNILKNLESRARRLYLEAYVMETVHPKEAKKRYMEIIVTSPHRSEYRLKAKLKVNNYN